MEKLEEEQTELIRKPLNENGVDVTEIENHGVIIINNSPESIEVIKPNECNIQLVSENVRKNLINSTSSNPQVAAQVQAEMQKVLSQLDQM
ncbi:hypothetical protein ENUP19_0266G0039 [Entamoeba nuttalli]|uniref:Uncharacterized protein n=2 Tax=Entamoeba nuttalli TaxID=412467 RepID=K2GCW8_ENTNP|nr:hypothetical protein ENU1_091490 [Entamoeba nuttalli P19]EKE40401.1 hypothetical protein ENU1_091490 [Entamoeba nuttalli P19]|eukprot:XP_008857259.1 hypothetical protein ENU1_091490 [Entamoeba nuttalli P19]